MSSTAIFDIGLCMVTVLLSISVSAVKHMLNYVINILQ